MYRQVCQHPGREKESDSREMLVARSAGWKTANTRFAMNGRVNEGGGELVGGYGCGWVFVSWKPASPTEGCFLGRCILGVLGAFGDAEWVRGGG